MTFRQAADYIEECNKLGSVPGLDNITELCRRLNDPQDDLKFIHIAGTNGKGSTLCYISSILGSAGLRVGRYISPTISDYLERFDIGGRSMSKTAFAGYIDMIRPICDAMVAEGLPHPTSFEIETAIAFLYFKDKKCDIVTLECGMGGALDATNVIRTTIMEVWAHIDMDHMQYLGDTLKDIAHAKAGILKPDSVAVTGLQDESVYEVLREECAALKVPLTILKGDDITDIKLTLKGGYFKTDGHKWHTPLLGIHQIYNSALAIKAIQVLRECRPDIAGHITDDMIGKGLDAAIWPGRMQILSRKPYILADGAHNPDAARRLKESLDIYFPDKKRLLIMGMLKDKDIDGVADLMCRNAAMVFTIKPPDNPRALSAVDLAGIVKKYNPNVSSLDSVEEAVEMAKLCADDDCVIIAFGSLSFMGRMISIINK